jgi:hypothetical protein
MPRYIFILQLADDTLEDAHSLECADADEAWERAKTIAQHVMQTEFERAPDWVRCSIVVKDEAGEVLLEFPFIEAVEVPASAR